MKKPSATVSPVVPRGLVNLTNACFLNAALQCVAAGVNASGVDIDKLDPGGQNILSKTLRLLWNGLTLALDPEDLAKNLHENVEVFKNRKKRKRYNQEDMHAAFNGIMDQCVKGSSSVFDFIMNENKTCKNCNHSSTVAAERRCLELVVKESDKLLGQLLERELQVQEGLRFNHDQENQSKCSNSSINHRWTFKVLPRILSILIKRHIYDEETKEHSLLKHPIVCPLDLNLTRSDDTVSSYKLLAVGFHSGSSLTSGHYFSVVRYGESWFRCNDNNVKQLERFKVKDTEKSYKAVAYMLFYEKNMSPSSLPISSPLSTISAGSSPSIPAPWECKFCTVENRPRAKTCKTCKKGAFQPCFFFHCFILIANHAFICIILLPRS